MDLFTQNFINSQFMFHFLIINDTIIGIPLIKTGTSNRILLLE